MITPIILSGGSGSRLWPLSRKESPKQFIGLIEKPNVSIAQEYLDSSDYSWNSGMFMFTAKAYQTLWRNCSQIFIMDVKKLFKNHNKI